MSQHVKMAAALLFVSAGFGVLQAALDFTSNRPDTLSPDTLRFTLLVAGVVVSSELFLAVMLLLRQNWARILYIVLMVVSLPMTE